MLQHLARKFWGFVERHVQHERQRALDAFRRDRVACGPSVQFALDSEIDNAFEPGNLSIGDHSVIAGHLALQSSNSRITVGHHCFVGGGSRIWAYGAITIGNHVLISHLVDIHDADGHPIDHLARREHARNVLEGRGKSDYTSIAVSPVVIEDDVWIGFKSTILKGVRVGRGAIVGAGSVVTSDVPPFAMVAGNPARVVRRAREVPAE